MTKLDNAQIVEGMAQRQSDIVSVNNPRVEKAIAQKLRKGGVGRVRTDVTIDPERLTIRRSLIESQESDPNGFERIIGTSDLLSVNFLTRGLRAAAAVCRIRVPTQGGEWFGTGFLVGPRLLMTNNHVLSSHQEASQSEAEFNVEHDADGVLSRPIQFNLAPNEVFYTDLEHDVTFVAISAFSDGGVPIERFGYLPLIPLSGKGLDGEWVTIIQHPHGQPKQLTIRANQITTLDKRKFPEIASRFIHYTTDTEPGSSGSPVLNDQWQVIALHHKAVKNPDFVPGDDSAPDPNVPEWLANEGVRVSSICAMLESDRFSNLNAAAVLERLSRGLGIRPLQTSIAMADGTSEAEGKPLPPEDWASQDLGYDPKFLRVKISLQSILKPRRSQAQRLKNSQKIILDYLHFSSVMHKERRFPMLTAVNIHGAKLKRPNSSSNSWRRDIRMNEDFQPGDNFYVKDLTKDPVAFDRGHLVRRLDPCWGDTQKEVDLAEKHTFHFTNAAPQVHHFNDITWGNLEDYVLDRAQTLERKVTVFSGPIFKPQDPDYGKLREHGPWKIPVIFWKIAVVEKPDSTIAATAFMIGQIEDLEALFETKVFSGLKPYSLGELQSRMIQTPIATVEQETGFDFSILRPFDAQDALESTKRTRFIHNSSDINL